MSAKFLTLWDLDRVGFVVVTDEINWPGLGDSPDRGRRIAALLFGAPLWVHRRVDSISLGSTGTTRRAISFDFTLPADLAVSGSDGRVLVPLALIEKGANTEQGGPEWLKRYDHTVSYTEA